MKFRFVLGIAILASITQLGLAADRRIKDITDTATSSAADDYLIIDGTTNGTRKILTTKLPVSEAQQTALDAKAGLTGTSVFLSGAAVTFNAGTSATFNGTLGGTPTGGTLDLSLVAVTLGNVTATTGNFTNIAGATAHGQIFIGNATSGNFTKATITEGDGITVTNEAGAITISANATGTNTGDQSIFQNIVVSGEDTVTANSTTGNLTFVEGSGMTITTDDTAKTVTFASSGGAGIPNRGFLAFPTGSIGTLPDGFLEADGTEGTDDASADNTAAITWLQKATGIAPTVSTMTVGTNGLTFTANMSESVTGTGTAGGGFALTSSTAEAITLGDISGSGTSTLTATASRTILDTETITAAYIPGDYVDGIGLQLAPFSGTSVTNGSLETGALTYDTQQDFEGTGATGTGWAASTAGNWDYTAAPLVGSQSGYLDGAYEDFTYTYSSDKSTIFGKFLVRRATAGTGQFYFLRILTSGDVVQARILQSSASTLRIEHGSASDETTATFATATTYYVWFEFTMGSAGTFKLWFNTTDSKPTGDATKQAEIAASTSGMSTGAPRKVQMRIDNSQYFIFDNFELAQVAIP